MTPATVHRLALPTPAATGPAAHPGAALTVSPAIAAEVRLVPPGAVPPGAVVLGHVIAVPASASATVTAIAVPAAPPAGGLASRGPDLVQCCPGLVLDGFGRRVVSDGVELVLTRREFDLLEHLVTHPGHAFSRDELLATVWERASVPRQPRRTVDVHVSRLRRKLGRHAALVQSLRGVGYRWAGRSERRDAPR